MKKISIILILLSTTLFGSLLFGIYPYKAMFGDSGLMYLQVNDLTLNQYSTFSFGYKGSQIDPNGEWLPYTKPFIGKHQGKTYIDFPPYFPLLVSPFFSSAGLLGLYIPGLISLLGTIFCLYCIFMKLGFKDWLSNLLGLSFLFGTSLSMYNFVLHEYPIALFLYTASVTLLFYANGRSTIYFLSGFLGSLVLFFRLEIFFTMAVLNFVYFLLQRKVLSRESIFTALGFLMPMILLFYLNHNIHGHILGLRYTLTITENNQADLKNRLFIIYSMLFSQEKGMFRQSPVLLAGFLYGIYRFRNDFKKFLDEKKSDAFPTSLFLTTSAFFSMLLILWTAPNDGDHIAPRYLFSIYLFLLLLTGLWIQSIASNPTMKWRRGLAILFTLLFIAGFYSYYKNFRWLKNSATNVLAFNDDMRSTEGEVVVFIEYASPLNLQNSYLTRTFFVAQDRNKRIQLLASLEKNRKKKVVFALPKNHPDVKTIPEEFPIGNWKISGIKESRFFQFVSLEN